MAILFSAIAKGKLILAKRASCSGNFTEVTNQVLSKISPEDSKLTYSSDKYLFHYVAENKLVYFCITDLNYPRSRAFSFLNNIKERFLASVQDTPPVASPHAAMIQQNNEDFDRVLEGEMTRYNDREVSKPNIKAELEELKKIMVKNVDKMAQRGERLETLMSRADELGTSSTSFTRSATQVQRKYWWKNIRMYVILAVALVTVVYFIGVAACGGLKWPKCI